MHLLNTDGGARGNPGPSAIAYVLRSPSGELIKQGGEYIGANTNNFAEYKALILGLSEAQNAEVKVLTCRLDSELVVKQLNGEYAVKDIHLKDLYAHVQMLVRGFDLVKFMHVPRAENKEADKLVNETLDKRLAASAK